MTKVLEVAKGMLKSKKFWAGIVLLAGAAGLGGGALAIGAVETLVCLAMGGCS